jgi:hypothetical protein
LSYKKAATGDRATNAVVRVLMGSLVLALTATGLLARGEDAPPAEAQQRPVHRHQLAPKVVRASGVIPFVYKDDAVRQELTVTYLDKDTVTFTARTSGTCDRSEAGRAKRVPGIQNDGDEDERGYFADEFLYKRDKDCWIYLRIEAQKQDKAKLSEAPACSKTCPFNFDLTMRPTK